MELQPRIEQEIARIVESEGLELVHIEYRKQGHSMVLRIDIDKEGGVTLTDCESISHQVGAFLDVEDAIQGRYELEVSSPGLDRKFYTDSDYRKFIGKLVRVKTADAVKGLHVVVGRLKSFDGSSIVVEDEVKKKDKDYEIALSNIKETRLEVEI